MQYFLGISNYSSGIYYYLAKEKRESYVGWGATHVGGFPDLSDVALERSVTQHQLAL
jgi:hypothetical protein